MDAVLMPILAIVSFCAGIILGVLVCGYQPAKYEKLLCKFIVVGYDACSMLHDYSVDKFVPSHANSEIRTALNTLCGQAKRELCYNDGYCRNCVKRQRIKCEYA